MLLDGVGAGARALMRLDGEKLALVVPFVERGALVEALIALQADQLTLMHRRQRLGDLGLADAGLAFEQQRPLEEVHEPQRRREVAVGDIADGGEALGDAVTLGDHPCRPSFSAAAQVRQWSCGMAICVEPRKANASLTALEKAGTPPTLGLSPMPLAPIGWCGDGVTV